MLIIIIFLYITAAVLIFFIARNIIKTKEITQGDLFAMLGIVVALILAIIVVPHWPPPSEPINIPSPSPQSSPSSHDPTATPPIVNTKLLLNEDFEDQVANDFRFTSGNWKVINDGTGNKVLEANNLNYHLSDSPRADFGPSTLGDYTIEYKVKLIEYDLTTETGSGNVWLGFREGDNGAYVFDFTPYWHTYELSYVDPQGGPWKNFGANNGIGRYVYQPYVWYTVRVEAYGSQIKAYLNGTLVFTTQDTRLSKGGLSLQTGPNMIAQFDNVRVSK